MGIELKHIKLKDLIGLNGSSFIIQPYELRGKKWMNITKVKSLVDYIKQR